LPALRDRPCDILLLAEYFCDKHSKLRGSEKITLDDSKREQLMGYGWPGNIRQLEHTIRRSYALGRWCMPKDAAE